MCVYDPQLIFWISCSFGIASSSSSSPDTPESFYSKTTKEAFLFLAQPVTWHHTGHFPLQRNKVPSKIQLSWNRWLYTPDEKQKKFPRNGRRIGRELGPVPTLFKSKMAGQLTWCNNKCIISMQGFVWVIFFIKAKQAFFIELSYPWMDGFIFSALKDLENHSSPRYCPCPFQFLGNPC